MTPSTKCLNEELRRVPSHWASSWRYVCVGCERGSAFVCGHLCAYKHVCVPMCASMLSLYMRYVCM